MNRHISINAADKIKFNLKVVVIIKAEIIITYSSLINFLLYKINKKVKNWIITGTKKLFCGVRIILMTGT